MKEFIQEKEMFQIKRRIEELKEEINSIKYNKVRDIYLKLNEIVKLRQRLNHKYTPRSLEKEEGLKITGIQVRFFFSYQYLTDYTLRMIKEKKITDSLICKYLTISSVFREVQWQKLLVEKLVNKEISPSQISELTIEEIKLFLIGKLKFRTSDKYFLTATKTLRSMTARIKDRKHLLKKSFYKQDLLNQIEVLRKMILEEVK
jgi:hypothetical protein